MSTEFYYVNINLRYQYGISVTEAQMFTVAQKGHTCKLKMLLQTKNLTCKLKIVHAN